MTRRCAGGTAGSRPKFPQTVDDGDDDDDDDDNEDDDGGGGGDWSSERIAANETQPSASVLMGILQKFTACRKEKPQRSQEGAPS